MTKTSHRGLKGQPGQRDRNGQLHKTHSPTRTSASSCVEFYKSVAVHRDDHPSQFTRCVVELSV